MQHQQYPIEFLESSNTLLVHTGQDKDNVRLTVINQLGETVSRMQFISSPQHIDLSLLPDGEYSVRLQCGENVRVKKINIFHKVDN